MSLFPEEYPATYFDEIERWVDEVYYEEHGDYVNRERSYHQAWDEEFLVIFATRKKLGDYKMDKNYSIMAVEVGVIREDIFLHNMELLELSDALLKFNPPNYVTKKVASDSISRCYQKNERFYVGIQEAISSLKRFIIEISDEKWYDNELIEPF